METKPCSRCSRPASFSLAFLLSTIGRTPRLQKCTRTAAFCSSCLSNVLEILACSPIPDLKEALQRAYTAFSETPAHTVSAPEVHHPENPTGSSHSGSTQPCDSQSDASFPVKPVCRSDRGCQS